MLANARRSGTSAALMILATITTAGLNGLRLWMIRLRAFSSLATSSDSALRRIKYVDPNSFFAILLGGNPVARVAATTTISTAFAVLAWSRWKSRREQSHVVQRHLWAATLTWTLIINVYAGIYDAILLVPVVALVARSPANRR
jgi:hypothetical protein